MDLFVFITRCRCSGWLVGGFFGLDCGFGCGFASPEEPYHSRGLAIASAAARSSSILKSSLSSCLYFLAAGCLRTVAPPLGAGGFWTGRLLFAKFCLAAPDALCPVFTSLEILVCCSFAFMNAAIAYFDLAPRIAKPFLVPSSDLCGSEPEICEVARSPYSCRLRCYAYCWF